jgi:SAM-dependent methyltransferase
VGSELEILRERERSILALRERRRALDQHSLLRESQREELRATHAELAKQLEEKEIPLLDWGELGEAYPLSPEWGADRGRCIDRWYIESFLERNALSIRGRVLELHDDDYTRDYGGGRVTHSDVLDIDTTNARATIYGDLHELTDLREDSFDTILLTQTLQYVPSMARALATCRRLLAPGGSLLATLPCLGRIAPEEGLDGDRWRLTPAGLRLLLRQAFPVPDEVEVEAQGNLLTCIAFLEGLACEDLSEGDFLPHDSYFPLLVAARVRLSGET